jgi:hypothetical protein
MQILIDLIGYGEYFEDYINNISMGIYNSYTYFINDIIIIEYIFLEKDTFCNFIANNGYSTYFTYYSTEL